MCGKIIGRSERIRTSDPLLPKQVRYQAALRSDRGRGVKPSAGHLQGGFWRDQSAMSRVVTRARIRLMRGMIPVSGRDFDSSTGRCVSTFPPLSRSTM